MTKKGAGKTVSPQLSDSKQKRCLWLWATTFLKSVIVTSDKQSSSALPTRSGVHSVCFRRSLEAQQTRLGLSIYQYLMAYLLESPWEVRHRREMAQPPTCQLSPTVYISLLPLKAVSTGICWSLLLSVYRHEPFDIFTNMTRRRNPPE